MEPVPRPSPHFTSRRVGSNTIQVNTKRWNRLFPGRTLASLAGFIGMVAGVAAADGIPLVTKGQLAFESGDFARAADSWEKAVSSFRTAHNTNAEIRTSLSLAGAFQALGQHRRAVQSLEQALVLAERAGDRSAIRQVKHQLGSALLLTLEMDRASALLRESLASARADRDEGAVAAILNDLGNSQTAQQKHAEALASYRESMELARKSGNHSLLARSLCNAASAAARSGDAAAADELNARAIEAINLVEPAALKASLRLTAGLTERLIKFPSGAQADRIRLRANDSFRQALAEAEAAKDLRTQTYALGHLAKLYEEDGQAEAALDLTRRAAFTAQKAQIPEALYRWEWQMGRLLKARNEIHPAVAAYRRSVQTLQSIRNDVSLGYGNSAVRQSFREGQGPLFFELADLLLLQAKNTTDRKAEQELLLEARDTVEQLKAVELEDYFCDDCVDIQKSKKRSVEAVDEKTAVVYVIPLATRTEVLVGITSGLKRFSLDVGAEALGAEVLRFRRNLETRTTYGYLEQAQQLHTWIIQPIRPYLAEHKIDTLVFVPDGALRTIPFASLHDGARFLIEDFAVAVVPGLSLVEPKPIERTKARMLLNGLSEAVQGWPPLNFVPGELRAIEALYPGDVFLDGKFLLKEFQRRMTEEQYSIVHIASHGQFDRDVKKTFILTHDAKLTLNDLEASIRPSQYRGRPVEMLVLSACQTAAGDDRAALGLAGVAVKAGARSALATLWFVNDQSTSALVSEVYSQLLKSPDLTKARALQAAQIKLLADRRYRHPCYWSPYLLIGNWL